MDDCSKKLRRIRLKNRTFSVPSRLYGTKGGPRTVVPSLHPWTEYQPIDPSLFFRTKATFRPFYGKMGVYHRTPNHHEPIERKTFKTVVSFPSNVRSSATFQRDSWKTFEKRDEKWDFRSFKSGKCAFRAKWQCPRWIWLRTSQDIPSKVSNSCRKSRVAHKSSQIGEKLELRGDAMQLNRF